MNYLKNNHDTIAYFLGASIMGLCLIAGGLM